MASTINNQMTMRLLTNFFGMRNSNRFGFFGGFALNQSWSFSFDSFTSDASGSVLKSAVAKLQSSINRTSIQVSGARTFTDNSASTPKALPEPTREDIDQAIRKAGGADAVSKWAVDGRTKLEVNGRKTVVNIGGGAGASESDAQNQAAGDPRADLVKSLARFGLDASSLDGGADRVRETVKRAATELAQATPALAHAIEYALEDAYAKIHAWDNAANGAAASGKSYEEQRKENLGQADSISRQLNLGDGQAWGITSMAEDLAVFGMDFTAMAKDPFDLAEDIRVKSREMLADLETRYVGTEEAFVQERNRITGASARLINGLEGSAGSLITASMRITGVTASASVSVGGVKLDASAVIAVGNVIVDPLVLDINGDGIDLSAAEEGVAFDMEGTGEQSRMGFVRGDDAFLFLDSHGDGVVHDGRQLFGNQNGYANGFDMLAQYDDNGDGVIDENDSIYDQLMIWQEKTEDGVCERNETMTLREAGIASINLGYQNVREDDGKGNLVGQTGSFTRDDGSAGQAVDVWLRNSGKVEEAASRNPGRLA